MCDMLYYAMSISSVCVLKVGYVCCCLGFFVLMEVHGPKHLIFLERISSSRKAQDVSQRILLLKGMKHVPLLNQYIQILASIIGV